MEDYNSEAEEAKSISELSDEVATTIKKDRFKKPWVALFITLLFPGFGHVYAGNLKKGILLHLGFWGLIFGIRLSAFTLLALSIGTFIFIVYYLFVLFNSFWQLKKSPKKFTSKYDKPYLYSLIIIVYLLVMNLAVRPHINSIGYIMFASISTTSMSPTLQVGDIMAVRKTKNIQLNDVAVFKDPFDYSSMYTKRCIGTPGVSIEVKNGYAYIDNILVDDTNKLQFQYLILNGNQMISPSTFQELEIEEYEEYKGGIYRVYIPKHKKSKLLENVAIKELMDREKSIRLQSTQRNLFPPNLSEPWSTNNYGPIYVPKKGNRITIHEKETALYSSIILKENANITLSETGLMLNGKRLNEYTFTSNYYFVLGDSRDNSLDSRYWGFLPESHIIGKGIYLCFGEDISRIGISF